MEIEDTSKLDIAPDDIASTEYLLKKTWRFCPISSIQECSTTQVFVETLIPSIRQYFRRKAMALGDTKLNLVLIHDILNVRGFNYSKGYYLKFTSEGRTLDLRCCVFSNVDEESKKSFLLIKGRKDLRSTYLEWFQQVFDVFIDYSSRRFSPYLLSSFCDRMYPFLIPSLENDTAKDTSIIISFRLPASIEGLNHITVTIPTTDVYRVQTNFPQQHYKCMEIVKKHLQSLLSIEPSICVVEEIGLPNVVITKDGRIKFLTLEGMNELLVLLSTL